MSGITADNTSRSSGLTKTASTGAPSSGSSNPTITTNPDAVGYRFVNTTSGEMFVATTVTTDENVWKGQLGTTVEPASYFGGRGVITGGQTSDIRLKEDIQLIGKSPSNINIYSFKYKGEPEYFEGVMAQEVPWVSNVGEDGFLRVDYSKIDVNFKKILRRE